jgi:hypothetical protein
MFNLILIFAIYSQPHQTLQTQYPPYQQSQPNPQIHNTQPYQQQQQQNTQSNEQNQDQNKKNLFGKWW